MSDIIDTYNTDNPDVVTGDGRGQSLEDYFTDMSEAQQAVPVRDGDDSLEVIEEDEPEEYEGEGEETPVENESEIELSDINFNPETLQEATNQMEKAESGFEQMKADIVNRGLPTEEMNQMLANYEATGTLTDQQYNRLAEHGYSKEFVDSYVQGQQALSQAYVNQFIASIGGLPAFTAVVDTLNQSSPKMVNQLERAIANRDLESAQAIIDLAGTIRKKTYGQPAQRTVTARAVPVNATPMVRPEGFASKQEMIAAMNDSKYGRDAAYTQEVQRKVHHSPW